MTSELCGICGGKTQAIDEFGAAARLQCVADENHFASFWDYVWAGISQKKTNQRKIKT